MKVDKICDEIVEEEYFGEQIIDTAPYIEIVEDGFGCYFNDESGAYETVRRFTLSNQNGLQVQIINYGATVTSIKFPDVHGNVQDVLLGYDKFEDYLSSTNPYFGATIGRVAHVISRGHFKMGPKDYQLHLNYDSDHLNGGCKGFDRFMWDCQLQHDKLVMIHRSMDQENGYPGELLVFISFCLNIHNEFKIEYRATTTKATPVNLTSNLYFNLAGQESGLEEMREHVFTINADKYVSSDERQVPTGDIHKVGGTALDFRTAKTIKYSGNNTNHVFYLSKPDDGRFAFKAYHTGNRRMVNVCTSQVGIHVDMGNGFPQDPSLLSSSSDGGGKNKGWFKCPVCGYIIKDPDFEIPEKYADLFCMWEEEHKRANEIRIIGKNGVEYFQNCCFRVAPQALPDALHRKHFPTIILKPGELYYNYTLYKFGLYLDSKTYEEEIPDFIIAECEDEGASEMSYIGTEVQDLYDTRLEENGR